MGVFSEMEVSEMGKLAEVQQEAEIIQPFSLEVPAQEEADDASEPEEEFEDDEQQQAEAEAAQEVLAKLTEEKGPSPEQRKKEHEEQEAKRKAEWEARQAAKQEAELMAWETAVAINDDELATASLRRVGTDAERLTRRNMKICVTEHIQTKCLEDMDFARQVMHPRKNMINCFKYINRQAREFAEQEMKDNEEKPDSGGYGTDVPDGLCYKWAEDYFNDLEAKEDKDKDDVFVPKAYTGPSPKSKKAPAKKPDKKPQQKAAPAKKPEEPANDGQLSFGTQTSLLEVPA